MNGTKVSISTDSVHVPVCTGCTGGSSVKSIVSLESRLLMEESFRWVRPASSLEWHIVLVPKVCVRCPKQ